MPSSLHHGGTRFLGRLLSKGTLSASLSVGLLFLSSSWMIVWWFSARLRRVSAEGRSKAGQPSLCSNRREGRSPGRARALAWPIRKAPVSLTHS